MSYHTVGERVLATRRVRCPRCDALPGQICDGRAEERPHKEREELDQRQQVELARLKDWNRACAG